MEPCRGSDSGSNPDPGVRAERRLRHFVTAVGVEGCSGLMPWLELKVFLTCLGYYLLGALAFSLPYLLYLILKELLRR